MQYQNDHMQKSRIKKILLILLFLAVGLLVNLFFSKLAIRFRWPLYLDNIGTLLGATLGGAVPGAVIGYLTNTINGIRDTDTLYYGVLSIFIAAMGSWFYRKRWFRSFWKTILAIVLLAVVGGGLGSILTWMLYGQGFGTGISEPLAHWIYDSGISSVFWAQLLADMAIDLVDKAIVVTSVLLILKIVPKRFKRWFDFSIWYQRPLTLEERRAVRKTKSRQLSLRYKVMIVFSTAMILIATVTARISFSLFYDATVDGEIKMGTGVANVVERMLNPDRIDDYIVQGEDAPDYNSVEKNIEYVLHSSPDIAYIYVYQIRDDGCHVVFDPDTEVTPGGDPGEVIPFEEGFEEVLPDLLAGKPIEPIITNDSFGWLLTIYQPLYDSEGNCKCYVGVDISMQRLADNLQVFIVKVMALFAGFFMLLLILGLWLTEYNLIMPLNSMAVTSSTFAFNDAASRKEGLADLKSLDIRTGDELENLYHAFSKTSDDMMKYVADVQEKNDTISRMQNNLILVLADIVESRDEYTGNHVRNTAEYALIIMKQLKKEGIYTDILTEEFIEDVYHSAPMHDLGKITIPDAILNKPGRLTQEEFEEMKTHAMAGKEIIEHAANAVAESTYLDEAQNLAAYHHEKWNGKGYPSGLSGEDIPLSARIMAVADVFDALVSRRSYKEGFPVEKAMDIIRDGMGTHFDPNIAQAFLDAEDEVRKVAEMQQNK